MAKSSNSAVDQVMEGAIKPPTPFTRLLKQMELEGEVDAAENKGSSATIQTVDRIMDDELSDDEIWSAGDLANIGGRNLVDVEQTVIDFIVKAGQREDIDSVFVNSEGKKFYLLIRSVIDGIPESDPTEFMRPPLEIGQEIYWNTSAPDVVPKLFQFRNRDRFPLPCVIRALDLGSGKHYLRLKPVPKRATRN
jgi:hypothetical protein